MGKKGLRGAAYAAGLMFLWILVGCGVYPTENQKQLNAQNKDAGAQIEAKAVDPEIKQAGKDVKENSVVLEKTLIGAPETPIKPYSPQNSAEIRTIVVKEYDEAKAPWYKRWAGYLLTGATVLVGVAGFAARFFPATAPILAIASPIVSALASLKQQADAHPEDKLSIDAIQSQITQLTKDPKVGPLVGDLLKKFHLEQMIHAPEAPDMPPPATAPA